MLQVTRTLCAGLSLGAADTALRVTLDFALQRKLYGGTVFEIPYACHMLVNAFVDLLICECVSLAATRALHMAPGQMSVWAAVVKYFVPTRVEAMIHDLAVVLGARHYLREAHDWGIFQKIERDNAIVSLFDGSTVVNLTVITQQLRQLTKARMAQAPQKRPDLLGRLEALFNLQHALPEFDPSKLELSNHGRDDIAQGMAFMPSALQELKENHQQTETLDTIISLVTCLNEQIEALNSRYFDVEQLFGKETLKSPELFQLSKHHCAVHAAATCVLVWFHNRHTLGSFFAQGDWLILCLSRLLSSLTAAHQPLPPVHTANVAQELIALYEHSRLFSLIPLQLAEHQANHR